MRLKASYQRVIKILNNCAKNKLEHTRYDTRPEMGSKVPVMKRYANLSPPVHQLYRAAPGFLHDQHLNRCATVASLVVNRCRRPEELSMPTLGS